VSEFILSVDIGRHLAPDPVLHRRATPEDLKLGASKIPEARSNGEDLNHLSFGDVWW
jgi:hypothetical protein